MSEIADKDEVTIPSVTTAGQTVLDRILQRLEELEYGEHDLFGIRLALEEALVNAIKHGNRLDPQKVVRISWQTTIEFVRIEIEDEGEGFVVEEVPDPTADENLERPCGRGIHLMRAFMNRIEYNERGNRVLLEKCKTYLEDLPPVSEEP